MIKQFHFWETHFENILPNKQDDRLFLSIPAGWKHPKWAPVNSGAFIQRKCLLCLLAPSSVKMIQNRMSREKNGLKSAGITKLYDLHCQAENRKILVEFECILNVKCKSIISFSKRFITKGNFGKKKS